MLPTKNISQKNTWGQLGHWGQVFSSQKNVAEARCCFAFYPSAKADGNGLDAFDSVKKNIFCCSSIAVHFSELIEMKLVGGFSLIFFCERKILSPEKYKREWFTDCF